MALPTRQEAISDDEIQQELNALNQEEDDQLKVFENDDETESQETDDEVETKEPDKETPAKDTESVLDLDSDDPVDGKVDWKKKFSESSREAQHMGIKSRLVDEAFSNALTLPEPTEDEIKTEFPDYEMLTSTEQRLIKDNLWNKKKFDLMQKAVSESKEVDQWSDKVQAFISDEAMLQKFPAIEGHENEFKYFATRPQRVGSNLPDLVASFTVRLENHLEGSKKRKTLMLSGKGGDKPQSKGYDADQMSLLRTKNPRLYAELLKSGKIKLDL